jgi:hypothetical protein
MPCASNTWRSRTCAASRAVAEEQGADARRRLAQIDGEIADAADAPVAGVDDLPPQDVGQQHRLILAEAPPPRLAAIPQLCSAVAPIPLRAEARDAVSV